MSERLGQKVALLGTIDPTFIGASATSTSDVVDARLYDSLLFVMSVGTITSSSSLTLTVYKGTASATVTSTVASASVTHLGDNTQKIVDVDVSKEGAYRYYKGTVVVNGGGCSSGGGSGDCWGNFALNIFGNSTRFHPASDNDLASVTLSYN